MDLRKIDQLICEELFGYEWDDSRPYYTKDMVAAWAVVERMYKAGYVYSIKGKPGRSYVCGFCKKLSPSTVRAETAPLAICLAALKALKREQE